MSAIAHKIASSENIRQHTAQQQQTLVILPLPTESFGSPTKWWRTREPGSYSCGDLRHLRRTLIRIQTISDKEWSAAIRGYAAASIAVSIRQLNKHVISAIEVDVALSAVLACAIEGDITSPVMLSSALRRRSKIDPKCHRLVELWLNARR
ncbi:MULTISPECIES: hypothetical protein [unclassified Bradyrhizobium]|uniref:hypothetical protein n=1 Tax=unclassified Bradyrhizobium TaxID=2631580 RepID=UPI0028EA5FCB|nr:MULTISPECIES: hypothetical protein [unclassified Bradyrhizobium]